MKNKIAVVGIGRLGLCFALNLERIGYQVFGIDNNLDYLAEVQEKRLQSNEPLVEEYLHASKDLVVTSDLSILEKENIKYIYIILPTPSRDDGSFSHDIIDDLLKDIALSISSEINRHIIIGSTVMPGYCDELAKRLEGTKFSVTYNPEFIAQGSIIENQQRPDQVLIGEGHAEASEFLVDLYARLCVSNPKVHIMSRLSAEITKLATNCYLTMKISFANAIGDLARSVGADEDKILSAIGSDSRIGDKYLKYGFGFGGPCFPRDNHALLAYSNRSNVTLQLSEATVKVNQQHLEFQLNELLNENKDVYYFESVAYKPNTDIIENSQQLELAKRLVDNGRKVVLINNSAIREKIEKLYPSFFEFQDEA